jgi:holin-like protein
MLNGMAILLFCQLCGEAIVRLFGWPIPGPVIGMLLLLAALMLRRRSLHDLDASAEGLLKYLALLFVPAGVGVMVYLGSIGNAWFALAVTLLGSIVITLVVTGIVMQWMLRRRESK